MAYNFRLELKALVAQAYNGDVPNRTQFAVFMRAALNLAANAIWQSVRSESPTVLPNKFPDELRAALTLQKSFVPPFADAVFKVVEADKDARPAMKAAIVRRVEMWVNSVEGLRLTALAIAKPQELVKWVLGKDCQDHCRDCVRLSKLSPRARKWFSDRGYRAGIPGSRTICGGWNCCCTLLVVKSPMKKITVKMLREATLAGLDDAVAMVFKANPNHEPAGTPVGGQFARGPGHKQSPYLGAAGKKLLAFGIEVDSREHSGGGVTVTGPLGGREHEKRPSGAYQREGGVLADGSEPFQTTEGHWTRLLRGNELKQIKLSELEAKYITDKIIGHLKCVGLSDTYIDRIVNQWSDNSRLIPKAYRERGRLWNVSGLIHNEATHNLERQDTGGMGHGYTHDYSGEIVAVRLVNKYLDEFRQGHGKG